MSEAKVETRGESGGETTETEQQASVKQVARKARAVKAAATSSPTPVRAEETSKVTALDEMVAAIKNMTVLELSQLVKVLEAEFGVTAALMSAPVAASAMAAPSVAAAPAEEQTEFNVMLKEIGANKISVIRAVRELTSLGLKESKDLVESAPKAVKERVSKDEAAAAKQKLEEAGAVAEVI